MANEQIKLLQKILDSESKQLQKLCDISSNSGGGPGGIQYSTTVEQACDIVGNVKTPIAIVRYYQDGVYISTQYRNLNGSVHTLVGTLGLCDSEVNFDSSDIVDAVNNNTTQNTTENGTIITELNELETLISDSQRSCGDPALKTLKVDICSAAPVTSYNNNLQQTTIDTSTTLLAANTYHSISIAIISGSAQITIGASSFIAPVGYTKQFQATTLLANSITIIGQSIGSLIVIDTIN